MIRCIILDIDGTLRDEKKGIPPTIHKVIDACKKQHILIGICTGRTYAAIQDDVYDLMFDFYMSGDGSQIRIGDTLIQDLYLKTSIVKDIIQHIKPGDGYTLETKDFVYMNQKACQQLLLSNQEKGIYDDTHGKILYQNTIKQYCSSTPVSKICIWSNERLLKRGDVKYVQHSVTPPYYYEMIHPDAGKGKAIQVLKKHLHIKTDDILCFGDGLNDISMFQACGHKVAMKKSAVTLQQYAETICEDIFEDGIYKELTRRKVINI